MLTVSDVSLRFSDRKLFDDVNIKFNAGNTYGLIGANGAGKSTLSNVITGKEEYEVTDGDIEFDNESILELAPEERAQKGIFMSFQYPIEIPGVSVTNFIKTSINETRKAQGLEVPEEMSQRYLNEGFSGGEKKRNEIFQMLMLNPKLAILDETDSGLDIDALRIVADGVNEFKNENNGVLVITHYQRLLDYIVPDFVHVLADGKIIKSGGKELALELEAKGYDWVKEEAGI